MESSKYLFLIYAGFLVAVIIFSLAINTILLKFATNLGIREQDQATIRWSKSVKPSLGGIVFYISFLLSVACYGIFFEPTNIFKNPETIGVLVACSLGFLMGLADDAYNTKPWLKFTVQTSCGALLILSGNYIQVSDMEWINYTLTCLWVIGLMNSINMLDNMDAITSVVSIFIIIICVLSLVLQSDFTSPFLIMMLGVLGSLIGFIFHNWNPSRMFMGDTGSQFLGVFISAISIKLLWNYEDVSMAADVAPSTMQQICLVLVAFILPISDTTSVVINRLKRGQSPFVGGRDHTTHHLSYLGLTDSQVAFVFIGISILSLLLAVVSFQFIEEWSWVYSLVFIGYALIVFGVLYAITKISRPKEEENEESTD